MSLTSPKQVISGFFRVHLWVILGLGTFGTLVAYSRLETYASPKVVFGLALAVTVLSYVGSIVWLYEATRIGRGTLVAISLLTFVFLLFAFPSKELTTVADWSWMVADLVSGGMLLGATFAAMLLGHWYLNSPSMKLDPLRFLLSIMAASILVRAAVCGSGLAVHLRGGDIKEGFVIAAVAMRWLAGIVGLGGMTWMTWETLKIPNTQSATGILYVALVLVFLGELASALVSFDSVVPL